MSTNPYGLDSHYFKKNLERIIRDIERYTPEEMHSALLTLAMVAEHQDVLKKLKAHGGEVADGSQSVV